MRKEDLERMEYALKNSKLQRQLDEIHFKDIDNAKAWVNNNFINLSDHYEISDICIKFKKKEVK